MLPVIEVIRLEEGKAGTVGALRLNKQLVCLTLEPPDRENQKNVSSIPAQQYLCERVLSNRFGETFEVIDVPGRSSVLFHPGNVVGDTQGCFLLGRNVGTLRGDRAVLASGEAFRSFLELLNGYDTFHLTIREEY